MQVENSKYVFENKKTVHIEMEESVFIEGEE